MTRSTNWCSSWKGKRFVGNHVSDYQEGKLDFLGTHLPHWYRKHDSLASGASLVIHFREAFLAEEFKTIPEMSKIQVLFQKARMGLHVKDSLRKDLSEKMRPLLLLTGMGRLICPLDLLHALPEATDYELLDSPE